MRHIRLLIPVLILCFSAMAPCAEGRHQLARDGKALAAIVVQKRPAPQPVDAKTEKKKGKRKAKPSPQEIRYGKAIDMPAKDLKAYLDRMTGANFPLLSDGEAIPPGIDFQIHVGQTKAALSGDLNFPSGFDPTIRKELFEEEGYVIKVKDKALYLVGNQSGPYRGTSYAVYDFLHRLGVRWYFPGPWGEVVPSQKDLSISNLDITEKPDFAVRFISAGGWIKYSGQERGEYYRFAIRNRMNPGGLGGYGGTLYPVAGDGFLALFFPNLFKEHPEYYAMTKKGERKGGRSRYAMLCLSNPDVLKIYTETVKKSFEAEKLGRWLSPNGIGISPPDGAPYCYCPECKKKSYNFDYPQYTHTPMISEPYFEFGAELAKRIPDKIIGLMAYSSRIMPPQGVTFAPNNSLCFAPIETDSLHPFNHPTAWRTQEMWEMLKQYRRQTPHVYIYDYNPGLLNTNYIPERETENIAVNAKMIRDLGIKGIGSEGRKSLMATWLSYYVTSRYLWNADESLDELKTDFYGTFFGPAGKDIRAWWDACSAMLLSRKIQAHEDWFLTKAYSLEFIDSIEPHIAAAKKAATAEPYKGRVQAVVEIAKHLRGFATMWDGEKQLDYKRALEGAQMMEDGKAALHKICGHFNNPTTNMRIPFMCTGNIRRLNKLIALTDGAPASKDPKMAKYKRGRRLADIPLMAKFKKDPYNEGVVREWYANDLDEAGWSDRDTFYFIEQNEDEYLDEVGHDFDGYAWYRMQVSLKSVPKENVRIRLGGVANEGWVWVNGQFVGHRKHRIWWSTPHYLDLDISKAIKNGENIITVRTYNNSEVGGVHHRGFIYEQLPAADAK